MTTWDDLYRQILESGPSAQTLFLVLSKLKQEGDCKRVVQECIKALNTYPDDIPIRQVLAEAYLETGFLSQAETELGKVTAQIDELVSAYKRLATLYHREKRGEEARKALHVYLAHWPEDQEARELLEMLRPLPEAPAQEPEPLAEPPAATAEQSATETPDLAREEAEETTTLEREQGLPEIATPTLAELYYSQGQMEEAILTYEKVVEGNPDDQRAAARLAELKAATPPKAAFETDRNRGKKGKMIALLEAWLSNIQEGSKDSMPA
jgi:tetratricopeptide (TPR) repeat protein